jgi:hypothetical protein
MDKIRHEFPAWLFYAALLAFQPSALSQPVPDAEIVSDRIIARRYFHPMESDSRT